MMSMLFVLGPARKVVRSSESTVPLFGTSKTTLGLDWGDFRAFWRLLVTSKTSVGVDWGDFGAFWSLLGP
jgi:hypothetical protein